MTFIVPRTCTELTDRRDSKPLADFRDESAYVLLGDPGAGKTTAFQTECAEFGPEAIPVTARDFIAFDPKNHPEWQDKTLFIDGLDEVRAGQPDARTPFEVIRGRLDALGSPSFRLSCRSADWLGATDQARLNAVSPNGRVTVLSLDPLNESDVSRILDANPEIDNPTDFIAEARERGVAGLLTNPQSLELLVKLVTSRGNWPEGRRETFQGACSQMADEHNVEHRIVEQVGTIEGRLDAAGRLCAIQLIADVSGYASRQRQGDEEYLDPDRCCYEDRNLLRAALSTKLFTVDVTGVARPIHRHIAEFNGALHLAKVIEDGLPAKRVIALMTGEDGLVVTELRGLSAWLAAVSKASRATLIDLDPIGVGLYGDIRNFSPEEKLALLRSLSIQASRPDPFSAAPAFADLAVTETSSFIEGILADSDRSSERQSFAMFLILVLACGNPMAELAPILLDIVRDATWRPDVRQSALRAFVNCCQGRCEKTGEISGLLASIRDGRLEDPNNELLGMMLSHLYPQDLPPSNVWDYLYEKGDPSFIGSYRVFWDTRLVDKSSGGQAGELLALLKRRIEVLRPALERHRLNELPLKLLERALHTCGDIMDVGDLYDWLRVGVDLQRVLMDRAIHGKIREWLERHPDTQKGVIAEGLSRYDETKNFLLHVSEVYRCLYGAKLPSDFGIWALKRAVAMADERPVTAEHLLERAVWAYRSQDRHTGLSIKLLRSLTAGSDSLKSRLDVLLSPSTPPPHEEHDEEYRDLLEDRRRDEAEWLDFVRSQKEALQENTASARLLFDIAECYLGLNSSVSEGSGVRAIEELLKGDGELIDAALQGLRRTIERPDIPDVGEVLKASNNNKMLLIAYPVLAGMAEIERTAPEMVLQIGDGQLCKAVAFRHSTHDGRNLPGWYQRILEARPEIVAEVKFRFVAAEMKADRDHVSGLWELVEDEDHTVVARIVSLSLLRVFPVRCRRKQTESLDILLGAAIQHADRMSLEGLIDKRLCSKRMNVAQKARWLAAGLIISSEKYLEPAERFAENSEYRLRHLAALFHTRLSAPIDVRVASLLIRLMGKHSGPDDLYAQRWVTPAEKASRLVRDLIARLSGSPDSDEGLALDALVSDPTLRSWNEMLSRARDGQRVIHRDASYRHPTVEQVCGTLSGSTPSNAADLAALLVDRLEELALRIHTGNTDDWRQYWNEGRSGQPPKPKIEENCRDALLSDLLQMLPEDVSAQPEGQYAGDRRSDIRVEYKAAFHVPVEIKKSTNRNLWSGMHDQLMRYYSSDPGSDGFGIYLVFWFGPHLTQKPPDGSIPDGPEELRKQLQATLSPEDARKITVTVIDVSPAGESDWDCKGN